MTSRRIVFYARGGGLGHFNRAYAIARTLQQLAPKHELIIITSSAFIPAALENNIAVLRWPGWHESPHNRDIWHQALRASLNALAPDLLVMDSFPNGPENELADWSGLRLWIQRDQRVTSDVPSIWPYPEGDGYILNRQSEELHPASIARQFLRADHKSPVIAVVHSAALAESNQLFTALTQALLPESYQVRLISPWPCPRPAWSELWFSTYPFSAYLHGVDLLIGGAGYNLTAESLCFGLRCLQTPFARPLDKQIQRLTAPPLTLAPVDIRKRVRSLLAAPAPIPESACQGALNSAQKILTLLITP